MPKKPRSDSKLSSLPAAAREDLERWLVHENVDYATAKRLLQEQHGVDTSTGALSHYYRKQLVTLRIAEAKRACDELAPVTADGEDAFVARAMFGIRQRFFEAVVSGEMAVDEVKALASVIAANDAARLKAKELELAERRVVAMERKAEAFDRMKGIAESQLTEEEKRQRIAEALRVS